MEATSKAMETSSKKQKQHASLSTPLHTKRRNNPNVDDRPRDLRARRVFSPAFQGVESDEKEKEAVTGELEIDGDKERLDFGGELERNVKLGVLACTRAKLYKDPSSFSYRRLLPFIGDLVKDSSNVLGIHPFQKSNKSLTERASHSPPASQNILVDQTDKGFFTDGHVVDGSSTSEYPSTEFTISNTTENSSPSTVKNSVIEELPHLHGENTPQTLHNMLDRFSKSHGDTCLVREVNQPSRLSRSLVVPESSIKEGGELDKRFKTNDGNASVESYDSEQIRSAPPDGDVFCKPGPGTSKDIALESSLNNTNVYDKNRCANQSEKDKHSNLAAKLGVRVPCSQMKLYKTPSSFSYRRLLPYLTDLAKNDTNTLGSLTSQNVDKRPPSFHASQEMLRNGHKRVPIDEHPFGGSNASPNLESTKMASPTGSSNADLSNFEFLKDPFVKLSVQNSFVDSSMQKPHAASIVSKVNGAVIMKPSHIDIESASKVQDDMLDKPNNVEIPHAATCIDHEKNVMIKSSPSLVIHKPLSLEEGVTRDSSLLPGVVDDCSIIVQNSSTEVKSSVELSLSRDSSILDPLAPSEKPACGPSLGILKKYPRGCRGICACLNCASFRLHAERAFEFSRNQVQETNELAMELMKELSDVRAVLEKSINGTQSHATVGVPQVKEACMKALRAEELAKRHLKQMNQELNIHCRTPCLQRPRVRFANGTSQP